MPVDRDGNPLKREMLDLPIDTVALSSYHAAAAAMIARRGMGLSEGLSASAEVPLGDGRHVALDRHIGIGRRHVWRSSWRPEGLIS